LRKLLLLLKHQKLPESKFVINKLCARGEIIWHTIS